MQDQMAKTATGQQKKATTLWITAAVLQQQQRYPGRCSSSVSSHGICCRTMLVLDVLERHMYINDHCAGYAQPALMMLTPQQHCLLDCTQAARACGIDIMYSVTQSLTIDGHERSLHHKLAGVHIHPGSWEAQVNGRNTDCWLLFAFVAGIGAHCCSPVGISRASPIACDLPARLKGRECVYMYFPLYNQ